jgi:hypothetical protein
MVQINETERKIDEVETCSLAPSFAKSERPTSEVK